MSRLAIFILFLTVTYCSTIKKREVDKGEEHVEGLEEKADNLGGSKSEDRFRENREKIETKREERQEEKQEDQNNEESEYKHNGETGKSQEGEIESEIEKKGNEEEESKEGVDIKNENSDNSNCDRESGKEQPENTLYLIPIENEVIYPAVDYEVPIVYYL